MHSSSILEYKRPPENRSQRTYSYRGRRALISSKGTSLTSCLFLEGRRQIPEQKSLPYVLEQPWESSRARHSWPGGPRGAFRFRALVLFCTINSSKFFFNDNSISAPFEVIAYINRICLIFSSCGEGKAKKKKKKSPHKPFPAVGYGRQLTHVQDEKKVRRENHRTERNYFRKGNRKRITSSGCENIREQSEGER